ncbi:probable WRKY transcription factor 19 [Brassica napus]|nr:probable WRKY transcription factor 19 [Brassica napus]
MLQQPWFKLRFINSPSPTIFTASRIEAEDGSPIAIELVDAVSNTRITSGPLSSSRVEIVALDADLTEESWTTEVFNRNLLWSREGKRSLLVGDLIVILKDGTGVISGEISFTDDSSWLKDGKFRLGARATEGGVVEAVTNAFACLAHRQGFYPGSGIWSLPKPRSDLWIYDHHRRSFGDYEPPNTSQEKRIKKAVSLSNIVYPPRGISDIDLFSYKNLDPLSLTGFTSDYLDNLEFPDATRSRIASQPQLLSGSSAPKDYDVVIRYRRGDVNNEDFISHLLAALSRRRISVYGDFDEVDSVQECKVLIILLTSTYVPPNLLSIVEQQRKEPQVVYPIFYGISPSDLISNSKYYEGLLLQDEPERCHAALREITQMPGYILTDKSCRSESELIAEIVRDALKVLCSYDDKKMIGMGTQIKDILSLLCIESPDVRSVGIWGTVGIGKTAIAEEIFRRISVQFVTCVFLKDLHQEVELKGPDAVREKLLSEVLEVEPRVIRISGRKTSFLRNRLQCKKVLVVLDDVNDFRDVETFLGKLSYFGPGSRIIITSRNRRVFVLCKINHVYKVKPLESYKALRLLNLGARPSFFSLKPTRTYSPQLVKFSNGNPMVLQFLSRSSRECLSKEIRKSSAIYIPGIFERSCCGLDDNEKSIFLDVACFFRRMDKDDVAMLLDGCGFSAHIGFKNLVNKSLLTISHNMVDMLWFLQATGREIVRQESIDRPGDRSRLWNAEDIRDVFIDNTGTAAIEGIFLDMSQLKCDANANVFDKMCNLRLLKFYFSKVVENHGVSLPQGLEYLPSKLRLLHWECYPISSLPQCFDPKNLIELNMPNSCVKKLWKGKKSLEKLKKMRLSYSHQLTKIPRLSRAQNLELLDLEGCKSLVSISQSICYLKELVILNLKDCSNLESIPSTVDLESLEVLNLSGCSKLENFPEISPNVKELYLGGTMLQEIPSSLKNLVLLEKLDLENSGHLVNLPPSICKLKHLETLNLSGCSSLERFPDLSRKMKCLKSLDLSRTAIKELPSSISYLTALEELRCVACRSLVRLPDNMWSLRFKVQFRQIDTQKFSRLWNRLGWLKKVHT